MRKPFQRNDRNVTLSKSDTSDSGIVKAKVKGAAFRHQEKLKVLLKNFDSYAEAQKRSRDEIVDQAMRERLSN